MKGGQSSSLRSHSSPADEQTLLQTLAEFQSRPEYITAVSQRFPSSLSVKQKAHMPVAFSARPMCPMPPGAPEISAVNPGSDKIVRCQKCRAYVNPFVSWESGGRQWKCNICLWLNETPIPYQCSLDETNRRTDRYNRPELCQGSVEFIAPRDYMVRPPQPPSYVFLIDVSAESVHSGLLNTVCSVLEDAFSTNIFPNTRTLIGIMTFDSTVHFYDMNAAFSQPHLLVVPDLSDSFTPVASDVLVDFYDNKSSIIRLVQSLPGIWAKQQSNDSCLGSALKFAHDATSHVGGKLMVFASSAPGVGNLAVTSRESKRSNKSTPAQEEMKRLLPYSEDYVMLATTVAMSQTAVELFLCPSHGQDVDLPQISPIAQRTSGEVHYYRGFNAHAYGATLTGDILRSLKRECGWESVVRFRLSATGWKILGFHGNFYTRNRKPDLLYVPNCHADQTFTVVLGYDENAIIQHPVCYIQSALLYTTNEGERRIRVHNTGILLTHNPNEVIEFANPEVLVSTLATLAIDEAPKSTLPELRNQLHSQCSQIITASHAVPNQSHVQNLKNLLPKYILGLLKCPAFRESKDITIDLRSYYWATLLCRCPSKNTRIFAPLLYSLSHLPDEAGLVDPNTNLVRLPPNLPLTSHSLSHEGAYVTTDGEELHLWIGRSISQGWVQSVFGISSLDRLSQDYAGAAMISAAPSNPLGSRVLGIIQRLQTEYGTHLKLHIYVQGESQKLEYRFYYTLYDDECTPLALSLQDFVGKLGGGMVVSGRR
eukprot:GHVP01062671.1.p1 GENE.GHVP01062671.1~~GHVP01062671.1.p1  ORF type:complete len:867 (+),score=119.62 GHVP01062671.1:305-2602(+)